VALAGADALCDTRAKSVGSTKTFHAYLSIQSDNPRTAVNARDRIGLGPWYNAKGQLVARSLEELHGDTLALARLGANISKASVLTEKGETPKGFGDMPNQHDILTGSRPDGTAYPDAADHTCNNWTSSSTGSAQLGTLRPYGRRQRPPGIRPTRRAAAARKIWSPPAERACSIASRLTNRD
jgi:hypothetical protein